MNWTRLLTILIALTILSACASRSFDDAAIRSGEDLPEQFLLPAGVDVSSGSACFSPLVDPRDGAEIRIVRSIPGRGDYEVPPRRYGVRPEELLRIDCGTGRPLGIVRR